MLLLLSFFHSLEKGHRHAFPQSFKDNFNRHTEFNAINRRAFETGKHSYPFFEFDEQHRIRHLCGKRRMEGRASHCPRIDLTAPACFFPFEVISSTFCAPIARDMLPIAATRAMLQIKTLGIAELPILLIQLFYWFRNWSGHLSFVIGEKRFCR